MALLPWLIERFGPERRIGNRRDCNTGSVDYLVRRSKRLVEVGLGSLWEHCCDYFGHYCDCFANCPAIRFLFSGADIAVGPNFVVVQHSSPICGQVGCNCSNELEVVRYTSFDFLLVLELVPFVLL